MTRAGEERKVKEEEMGERARCALREAAMVVAAAGRKAGSSKILFTIHAGVVRRALCRSVGRPVRLASRSRAMRANERARCQISKEGKIAFLPSLLPFLMLRKERRTAANAKLPPLLHSDLRGVPE